MRQFHLDTFRVSLALILAPAYHAQVARGTGSESTINDEDRELIREAVAAIDGEERFALPPEPEGMLRPIQDPAPVAFRVLNADERIIEGLYRILETFPLQGRSGSRYLSDAANLIGVIGAIRPGRVDERRLLRFVERMERSALDWLHASSDLYGAYLAVGRLGSPTVREFLLHRVNRDFWGPGGPKDGQWQPPLEGWDESPRSGVLAGLWILGREEDVRVAHRLIERFKQEGDEAGARTLGYLLERFVGERHDYFVDLVHTLEELERLNKRADKITSEDVAKIREAVRERKLMDAASPVVRSPPSESEAQARSAPQEPDATGLRSWTLLLLLCAILILTIGSFIVWRMRR